VCLSDQADPKRKLCRFALLIDWEAQEQAIDPYLDEVGAPALPVRLMGGLLCMQHAHEVSDEAVVERWVDSPVFGLLVPDVFPNHLLISTNRRGKIPSSPEMLAYIVPPSIRIYPGNMDRTLFFDKSDGLSYRVLRRYRNHHVHVIRHQVSFFNHAFLLHRQSTKHFAQFLPNLPEYRLFAVFRQ